jgi:hypothetical protein
VKTTTGADGLYCARIVIPGTFGMFKSKMIRSGLIVSV